MPKKSGLITLQKNRTPIKTRKLELTKTVKIKHVILLNSLYKKIKNQYKIKPQQENLLKIQLKENVL